MRIHGHKGRSVTHVHDDHLVPDAESLAAARAAGLPWFKGGMVEHAGPAHPIARGQASPRGARRTRTPCAAPQMREHLWGFCMQGEDLPQPTNRVDLDPTDSRRPRVPGDAGHLPPAPPRAGGLGVLRRQAASLPRAAGAEVGAHATPHRARSTRSRSPVTSPARRGWGRDPATSVCDPWGRLHDVPNVVVADSSLFPTGAGYGPTLTLVALAIRNIGQLAGAQKGVTSPSGG